MTSNILWVLIVKFAFNGYGNTSFVLNDVWIHNPATPKSGLISDIPKMYLVLVYLDWFGLKSNNFTGIHIHLLKNKLHQN